MRYTISFDVIPQYVHATFEGDPVEVHVFDAMMGDMASDPRWDYGMNVLVDMREIDLSQLDAAKTRQIKGYSIAHAHEVGDGRLALVVRDAVAYGIARMYELDGDETDAPMQQINVFYSLEDARAWLTADSE